MKTILKVTLVFVLAVISTATFAAGNLKLNVSPVSGGKALVDISSLTNNTVSLKLSDEDGNIVYYKENLESNNDFRKIYDFSKLEDGNYKLTVVSDGLVAERQLKMNHQTIEVGDESTVLKPYFAFQDEIFKCSYLNFMKDNVRLCVYQDGQLMYSKKVGSHFSVNEGLSLRKLEPGDYSVCLVAGENEFYYNIKK